MTVKQLLNKEIMDSVKKITEEQIIPRAQEIDKTDEFPHDLVKILGENGLLTMSMPEEYGGINADSSLLSLVIEELSRGTAMMGTTMLSTHTVIRIVSMLGTQNQKDNFFKTMSDGNNLCAICITESEAGSDARSLQTTAKQNSDGSYTLNGTKIFVTLAKVAKYYLVFAKTDTDEMSAFLVDKDSPGLEYGIIEEKMGLHGSMTGDIILNNCQVSEDALIGDVGEGWKILAELGNSMRSWGAASIALGIAQSALDYAVEYAKERKQFNKRLGDFQALRFMLADCAMELEAARSLVRITNELVDEESPNVSYETMAKVSMSKCKATDVAMQVTTDAVQIFGGYGYIRDYPVERLMRDAKVFQILDGSNQVQRMIIGSNLMRD